MCGDVPTHLMLGAWHSALEAGGAIGSLDATGPRRWGMMRPRPGAALPLPFTSSSRPPPLTHPRSAWVPGTRLSARV